MARASDDTRERTIRVLRAGLADGRLSADTFEGRMDAAFNVKTREGLAGLTRDLERRRPVLHALRDLLPRAQPPAAATEPLEPPLAPKGKRLVLGRDRACDYTISERTVSSRHAELERTDDGWLIRDLQSRNGTRVNGWLVSEQSLRPGDELELGFASFVFTPRD